MKYRILLDDSFYKLEIAINKWATNGWRLLGPVQTVSRKSGYIDKVQYTATMFREKKHV